jgi:hypothetical protein
LRRESRAQERHRKRHQQCGANALHCSCGDKPPDVAGERTGYGRYYEQAKACHEHASAPEAIAQRGTRQEQHREAQVISVHGPLERFDRRAEVQPDRAERGRDDQRIERGHERGHRGERKHPDFSHIAAP